MKTIKNKSVDNGYIEINGRKIVLVKNLSFQIQHNPEPTDVLGVVDVSEMVPESYSVSFKATITPSETLKKFYDEYEWDSPQCVADECDCGKEKFNFMDHTNYCNIHNKG